MFPFAMFGDRDRDEAVTKAGKNIGNLLLPQWRAELLFCVLVTCPNGKISIEEQIGYEFF